VPKRVFIVHGWGGTPDDHWCPWLKKMLLERGFEVYVPQMPNTNEPRIATWVPYLAKVVGKADENTYFVGHSIGCQAILRYLETLERTVKVGGAVFVAGFFNLISGSMETDAEKSIAKEWIGTPIDFQLVRDHLNKSTAIFSDNDPDVPLSDSKIFDSVLGSKIIVHPNRGHFTKEDGVTELHVAFNEIMQMAKD